MKMRLFIGVALALACAAASGQSIKGVVEHSSYTHLQDGKVAGPAAEIVEAILKRAGLHDYRAGLYPWARAYDMALQEPNVLIFLIARTPARERLFKWVGEFTRIDYHFYKLRDNKDIVLNSLHDAKAYSVGVIRDDVRHAHLASLGFTKLVVSAQNVDNFRKLLNQQVQLVPMPDNDAALLSKEANIDLATLEKVPLPDGLSMRLFMAYSRSTPDEIVARTRAAFEQLKTEGMVARLMNLKR